MPLTQGIASDMLFFDGLRIQPRNVFLGGSQYLRVEHMPRQLIGCHVLRVFLFPHKVTYERANGFV